jgi:hypothetical protein
MTFCHADAAQVAKLLSSFRGGGLMAAFSPLPSECRTEEELRDWKQAHWGAQTDVIAGPPLDPETRTARVEKVASGGTSATIRFETPHLPPLAFYESLERRSFEVEALYYARRYACCGIYGQGSKREYRIMKGGPDSFIPTSIDEAFGISTFLAERDAELGLTRSSAATGASPDPANLAQPSGEAAGSPDTQHNGQRSELSPEERF